MLTGHDLLTIERTLQLAIAPAFLLGGVFALLTLLTNRLQRLSEVRDEMKREGNALPVERRRLARRFRDQDDRARRRRFRHRGEPA